MGKTKRDGCLKAFLIIVFIAFLLIVGGLIYLFDALSGRANRRAEARINKELVKNMEPLPEQYASYTDLLSELRNSGKFEIDSFSTFPDRYYFLPDDVLVMAASSTGHFYKINSDGEIIDHYHNPTLELYGQTLMRYTCTEAPPDKKKSEGKETINDVPDVIIDDDRQYVLSGYYNNWPLSGDTTLLPIVPISEIASNREQTINAYKKADVVKEIFQSEEINLLYTANVWYASDILPREFTQKHILTRRSTYEQPLDIDNVKIEYLNEKEYHRATSSYMGSGSPEYYSGDAYLKITISNIPVPFKIYFTKTAHFRPQVKLDIIKTTNYAIINNYLIREKRDRSKSH